MIEREIEREEREPNDGAVEADRVMGNGRREKLYRRAEEKNERAGDRERESN